MSERKYFLVVEEPEQKPGGGVILVIPRSRWIRR